MASASSSAPNLPPFISEQKPRTAFSFTIPCYPKVFHHHGAFQDCFAAKLRSLKVEATPSKRNTKPNSVICGDCNGDGAVVCSQCKGNGVNAVDFFNGEFKAGDSCWLCGGKKQMLCGNCNGAGFIGGFLSTDDQ